MLLQAFVALIVALFVSLLICLPSMQTLACLRTAPTDAQEATTIGATTTVAPTSTLSSSSTTTSSTTTTTTTTDPCDVPAASVVCDSCGPIGCAYVDLCNTNQLDYNVRVDPVVPIVNGERNCNLKMATFLGQLAPDITQADSVGPTTVGQLTCGDNTRPLDVIGTACITGSVNGVCAQWMASDLQLADHTIRFSAFCQAPNSCRVIISDLTSVEGFGPPDYVLTQVGNPANVYKIPSRRADGGVPDYSDPAFFKVKQICCGPCAT